MRKQLRRSKIEEKKLTKRQTMANKHQSEGDFGKRPQTKLRKFDSPRIHF